jgi:hypothetical protein
MLLFIETFCLQNNVTTFTKLLFFKFLFAQLFGKLVTFLELNIFYPVTTVLPSTIT